MKWMGALMVIAACGGLGFLVAANDRSLEREVERLERVLEWISRDLSGRMWPLPALFCQVGQLTEGTLKKILLDFAQELEQNTAADAGACMELVLGRYSGYPLRCKELLAELGKTLGRYELQEQLCEIAAIHDRVRQNLQDHRSGQKERLRCYRTLGLCGGIGLAILLL